MTMFNNNYTIEDLCMSTTQNCIYATKLCSVFLKNAADKR